jgi:hypothetical protein
MKKPIIFVGVADLSYERYAKGTSFPQKLETQQI